MKNRKFISVMVVALAAIGLSFASWMGQPKIGIIDNARLVSEFNGMKEAQQQLKTSLGQRKFQVDSMKLHLENEYKQLVSSQQTISKVAFEKEKAAYVQLNGTYQQQFELYQERSMQEEQATLEQVTAQLNAYVKTYAEQSGYDYLLGATGMGNVWYMRDEKDVTEEVIEFVNQKYEGI